MLEHSESYAPPRKGAGEYFRFPCVVAIFAAAAIPVMLMTGVLEAAGGMVVATLAGVAATAAISARGHRRRAHGADCDRDIWLLEPIPPPASARRNRNRGAEAAPLKQRIAVAESQVHDLDNRIAQLDDMVKASTTRGRTKVAIALVGNQAGSRAELLANRQSAAMRVLRVEEADVEARRVRIASESGPALYLAKLFGSDDTESVIRLISGGQDRRSGLGRRNRTTGHGLSKM